jgi:hypothetical protein
LASKKVDLSNVAEFSPPFQNWFCPFQDWAWCLKSRPKMVAITTALRGRRMSTSTTQYEEPQYPLGCGWLGIAVEGAYFRPKRKLQFPSFTCPPSMLQCWPNPFWKPVFRLIQYQLVNIPRQHELSFHCQPFSFWALQG